MTVFTWTISCEIMLWWVITLITCGRNLHRIDQLASTIFNLKNSRHLNQKYKSLCKPAWGYLDTANVSVGAMRTPQLSVTRLGDFGNFLATKFITKIAQMLSDFWAVVKSITFRLNWLGYFLGNFWKNLGYFLIQHLVTLPQLKTEAIREW